MHHQYGRRIEADRSGTIYHVFTGIPARFGGYAMTGLSRLEATSGMLRLNLRNNAERRGERIERRCQDEEAVRKGIVPGGAGTATRTVGLLGGILTYAIDAGIIEINPAYGIKKPKNNVRNRRLTEAEYRTLGQMLRQAAANQKYAMTVDIIRQIALAGCRQAFSCGRAKVSADPFCG